MVSVLEKQQPVDLVHSRAEQGVGKRGRSERDEPLDRLHERVLRLSSSQRLFGELEVWGTVFYPRDEGQRRSWVSCAEIGVLSAKRDKKRLEKLNFWENLLPDLWALKASPQQRCRDGLIRWEHCRRVAEVVLLTLWCRRNDFKYRNLEHWRRWIAHRDGISHGHLKNRFGEFKDSSHLTAAFLKTPFQVDAFADLLTNEEAYVRAIAENYVYLLDFSKVQSLGVFALLAFVAQPLLHRPYLDELLRRAETLRIACEKHRILDPKQAWVVADVTPLEDLELEPPPQEAIDWLEAEFPG